MKYIGSSVAARAISSVAMAKAQYARMAASFFTHIFGVTFKNDAGTITSTTDTYIVDSEVNFDDQIAAGVVNKEFDLTIAVAKVKTLCIFSDQDLVLKVNSTSSPAPQLNLAAGKQIVWNVDHLEALPLTTDVTKFYFTNAGLKVANIKFRCGLSVAI